VSNIKHLAIIPDGNGRWALAHGFERSDGHREGAKRIIPLLSKVCEYNIPYLTFYALSTENFDREPAEIQSLQEIMHSCLGKSILPYASSNSIKIKFIGKKDRLIAPLIEIMQQAEEQTKSLNAMQATFAIDYGSRQEIADACKACAAQFPNKDFGYDDLQAKLYTTDIPDPDIVIRYGGHKRLSNFMLLQSAYSELVFMEKFWPDFSAQDIDNIVKSYPKVKRNYGKL